MLANRIKVTILLLGTAILASGCMTTKSKDTPADTDAAVEQAAVLADNGQPAKAMEMLDKASKADPANAKPWVKKAQIQFQAADYPSAIQSAEEAAKRDPTDKEARSISIVAALRIAIRGLVELRGEEDLGENAYAEAQRLASVLKASLGTEVLVPANDVGASGLTGSASTPPPPATKKAPVSPSRPVERPVRRAAPPPAEEPKKDPPKDASTDPFKDLH